jgi:hypothetical protein
LSATDIEQVKPSLSSSSLAAIPPRSVVESAAPPEEKADPTWFRWFKGFWAVLGLAVGGALYWVLMLWDWRRVGRRTRHFRIKLNNAWRSYFHPAYVKRHEAWRQGECAHCGACCEILWRCPFLRDDGKGNSHCSIHKSRPLPCRTFPIDPKTVSLISVDRPADRGCSYRFQMLIDQKREEAEARRAR